MKTEKGTKFSDLVNVDVKDSMVTFYFPTDFTVDATWLEKALPAITERILQDRKPAGTLLKCLTRLETHRAQYMDALETLVRTYNIMVTPQTRTSAKETGMAEILNNMSDPLLKTMSKEYLPDTYHEYIFPDDRAKVISAIVQVVKNKLDKKE